MAKKRIKSRPGLWGMTYHYDENGKYVGKSRPGLLGDTKVHFDSRGQYVGKSRPGFFSEEVHFDAENQRYISSYPGIFGSVHRSGGRFVGKTTPGLFGTQYTEYDMPDGWEETIYAEEAECADEGERSQGHSTKPGTVCLAIGFLAVCFLVIVLTVLGQ